MTTLAEVDLTLTLPDKVVNMFHTLPPLAAVVPVPEWAKAEAKQLKWALFQSYCFQSNRTIDLARDGSWKRTDQAKRKQKKEK